jgi:hypothetical protein
MDAYLTSRIDDLPQIWDGFAKLVRAGLGITAFGANVMDVPADYQTRFHDESGSGQEELYVALRGSGWVVVEDGGEQLVECTADTVTVVRPETSRAFRSGPDGCRLLIVGGTPGQAYEVQAWSSGGGS